MKTGEVARFILEAMHGKQMVGQSNMVWEALNKAFEKDDAILSMAKEIGFPSEAWRALVKIDAETNDAAAPNEQKKCWRISK